MARNVSRELGAIVTAGILLRGQRRIRGCLLFLAGAMMACAKDSAPTVPASTVGTFATDPAAAELTVSDISNFWAAYDEYRRTGSAAAFQSLYLNTPSAGLVDFIKIRGLTASSLAQMVDAFPQYLTAIRPVTTTIMNGTVSQQVRKGYVRMAELYPATVFPTVTFLIGRFSTAGTTANNRILVGSEFYSANEGVPLGELGPFQRDNAKSQSWLPVVVAHEHVHILQSRTGGIFGHSTLLEQSLAEGTADFIGELVSDGNINARLRDYALPHEHQLWVDFQAVMTGTDVSQWLYNQTNAATSRPGDLGYFIGYRIAEAYYAKATNKTQAIKDMIEVSNAQAFLHASGYNP